MEHQRGWNLYRAEPVDEGSLMNEKEQCERLNEIMRLTIAPTLKDNTRKLNVIIGLQYLVMLILLGVTIITCTIILSTQ